MVRLGGAAIDKVDLLPWLDNWIEAAQRELGGRNNEDEAFEAVRQEADRRFKAGLEDASSPLMEEFAREERAEHERQREHKRRRLRLLEEAVRFDELAFNAEFALHKLRLMAEIEGISEGGALGNWLFNKAYTFYQRGEQKAENTALLVAIAAYRDALKERPASACRSTGRDAEQSRHCALEARRARERDGAAGGGGRGLSRRAGGADPRARAARLGDDAEQPRQRARGTRAARERHGAAGGGGRGLSRGAGGTDARARAARLGDDAEQSRQRACERSASARAGRRGWRRRSRPIARRWRNGRASACRSTGRRRRTTSATRFETLGERESGTARLEEAVAAYRAALEERTRERVPLDWATTQNNLGNALWTLGERESGTARLEEAVAAYRAALRGTDARAGAARLGDDAEQSRQRACDARASARAGRRGWRRRSRPIAPRWRNGRASGCRSTGRRRRTTSATRLRRSGSARAARRGWRRRSRPIARRWRKGRASGCRSTGR